MKGMCSLWQSQRRGNFPPSLWALLVFPSISLCDPSQAVPLRCVGLFLRLDVFWLFDRILTLEPKSSLLKNVGRYYFGTTCQWWIYLQWSEGISEEVEILCLSTPTTPSGVDGPVPSQCPSWLDRFKG